MTITFFVGYIFIYQIGVEFLFFLLEGIMDGRHATSATIARLTDCQIKAIKTVRTLLIDEISMMSYYIFNKVERVLRYVRNVNKPFGGMQIILCGDFRQLQPVPNARFVELINVLCFIGHFL